MAVGQAVLTSTLDVAALDAVEAALATAATERCAAHGRRLRLALRLHAVLASAGGGLATTAHLSLVEQTSEQASQELLALARLLAGLPGGLEALECGLLTVEQSAVVGRRLGVLPDLARIIVWDRVRARLVAAHDQGEVLTPARLAELIARWAVEVDPAEAVRRRQAAESHGSVDHWRRDDGLADLRLSGIRGPDAQAILSRIRDRSRPWGGGDDRSAGKRRLDAAVSLLLGRDQLPLDDSQDPFASPERPRCTGQAGAAPCGCRIGELAPCGAGISLLVPLGAALGTTDEVAVLEGHGPVEPDLLQALLHAAPTVRPVWVDDDGVPVSVGEKAVTPPRGDPAAVRAALLRLAALPPGDPVPRHPGDHGGPSAGAAVTDAAVPDAAVTDAAVRRAAATGVAPPHPPTQADPSPRPRVLQHPHPVDTPGPYRVPTRLARLLRLRSPRCEWPACGHRSAGCDLDHDRAHPAGATCGCNLGPACRRHHRVKQLLMAKARGAGSAVTWTSPTGRRWTSPSQHQPPASAVRALGPLPDLSGPADPFDDEDGSTDTAYLDGTADRLRADEPEPPTDADLDEDPFGRLLGQHWGLVLDDPTGWTG